jgi:hypothetical protein
VPRVGDVEHHHHAMAASALPLLQNLQHTIFKRAAKLHLDDPQHAGHPRRRKYRAIGQDVTGRQAQHGEGEKDIEIEEAVSAQLQRRPARPALDVAR